MIKRICDKCESDINVSTLNIPFPTLTATGGMGSKRTLVWSNPCGIKEMDLCSKCQDTIGKLIGTFFYAEQLLYAMPNSMTFDPELHTFEFDFKRMEEVRA